MFVHGQCLFGQCGSAQSHLRNQGVGVGDTFLFFGLFADEQTGERHHRIFGYLEVAEVFSPSVDDLGSLDRPHPHTLGDWNANNTVYRGCGAVASRDHESLRLTQPGGPLCHWIVPNWLRKIGLSFHGDPARWLANDRLKVVSRGQEFVADIGNEPVPQKWLTHILRTIRL